MKRSFVLFGVVVAVILATVIIFYVLQSVGMPPSAPVASAFPIYKTNTSIISKDMTLEIFNENFEGIINTTKTFLSEGLNINNVTIKNVSTQLPRCVENGNTFSQYVSVTKRKWNYDTYWVGDFKEEKYVFNVPLAPKNQTWKFENGEIQVLIQTCKNPSEVGSARIETGEFYCASGIIQVWKIYGRIKFIMDDDGIVYFGGVNC